MIGLCEGNFFGSLSEVAQDLSISTSITWATLTQESPTGGLTTYSYDLDGDVLSTTDPDDHTITYSYNADNEETGETWVNPSGGTPLDVFDYALQRRRRADLRQRRQQRVPIHLQRRRRGDEPGRRRLARPADGDIDVRI